MRIKFPVAIAAMAIATVAQATTIIVSLPEFNGDGTITAQTVGTFNFVIPAGEHVVTARIDGQFGNSVTPSTATQTDLLDGVTVANCAGPGNFCWDSGPEAWSHVFFSSELAIFGDGNATLVANQTDCCVVRLGVSTLTLTTASVPEPATWGLMIVGFGLVGASTRRRSASVAA